MSTKGRDTSMKEKRGRSPTLSRKIDIGQKETRGRSTSLPRKPEIRQRGRSLNPPSILERKKKTSTSVESRKVPTIPRPSVASLSRGPSTRNPKRPLSPPKTKSLKRAIDRPTPPFKVMSTKSKSNPKNTITSSMKTSGSVKPKASTTSRSPLKSKNSINVKETNVSSKKQTSQTTKGLASKVKPIAKKPIMSDALSLPLNNQNIVTNEEHNHNVVTLGSNDHILHGEGKFEDSGQILVCEPSDSIGLVGDHIYDHGGHINQQDQEPEYEQVAQEADVESIDENVEAKDEDIEETKLEEQESEEEPEDEEMEQDELVHEVNKVSEEYEETDIEEEHEETQTEIQEDDVEEPKNEDTTSNMVINNQEVVIHGKKDTATYNDVIEETVSKLREQSKNRVLALAGAFETVISLESDSSPKDLSPKNY